MSIRKQTLEEWFTDYQLMALSKSHFYLPINVEVDVTRLSRSYAAEGRRAPLFAMVVKAAAVLAAAHPEVNRAVLRTPFGARVVQFEEAHVNVPIRITHNGKEYVSATVVKRANTLSIPEIEAHIQAARSRPLSELPIASRLVRGRNTVVDRCILRARHFAAYSIPSVYERFAGGISVSSVMRTAPKGVKTTVPSYGPTAFSMCPGPVRDDGGRVLFNIGIGYDHTALPGLDALRCADAFGELLHIGDPALFGPPLASKPNGIHAARGEAPR